MKIYELKNGGYAFIDHVTIENIYKIFLEDETDDTYVEMYDNNGNMVANSYVAYCNEIGYCEYDNNGIAKQDICTIYTY